jgi:hypothetical protein
MRFISIIVPTAAGEVCQSPHEWNGVANEEEHHLWTEISVKTNFSFLSQLTFIIPEKPKVGFLWVLPTPASTPEEKLA